MSQHIPQPKEDFFSLPDFHDDEDLFNEDPSSLVPPSHRRRIFIILSIVLLLLLLASVVFIVKQRTHIVYQTKKITQGDLALAVTASGTLHTNIYTVNFMEPGKLAAINVSAGQDVKKGQILAKLDPTSLQNALNEAQANVSAAQTALDNANANYAAIRSANQPSTIQPASISIAHSSPVEGSKVNASTLNTMQAPMVSVGQFSTTPGTSKVQETEALGQIKDAQKALALAQTKVATAQYNLNNTILKAPYSGTIATLNGVVGEETAATFIQIVDPSSLQLQVNVNEDKVGAIAVGDAVSFTIDAYPDQSFDGNIVTILPLSQYTAGNVTYPVLITPVSSLPSSVHLLPGMTGHATITTYESTKVIIVPASALAFARAQAKSSNQSLVKPSQIQDALTKANEMVAGVQQNTSPVNPTAAVVLERNAYDKISVIPIVVGITNGAEYEVLDGLSANDVVLVGV
jgi:HlyD family secretion protein